MSRIHRASKIAEQKSHISFIVAFAENCVSILFLICTPIIICNCVTGTYCYRIVVHLGSSVLDLGEGIAVSFSEPIGWQVDFRQLSDLSHYI